MSVSEVMSLPYPELNGWIDYFSRYPVGWREDYRAYTIVASFAGSDKVKPEDVFESLKTLKKHQTKKEEEQSGQKAAISFLERFGGLIKKDQQL